LYFTTWDKHQQKRAKYSKFPDPIDNEGVGDQEPSSDPGHEQMTGDDPSCNHMKSDDVICPRESRSEKREYEKREYNVEPPGPTPPEEPPAPKYDEDSIPYQ